jgi:hypothetical protein
MTDVLHTKSFVEKCFVSFFDLPFTIPFVYSLYTDGPVYSNLLTRPLRVGLYSLKFTQYVAKPECS